MKDLLCFRDNTAIIREHHKKMEASTDEKTLLIETASKLILHDIQMVNLSPKYYPTVEQMTDLDSQLDLLPQSLKSLLKPLVKSDERVASWGKNSSN